MNHLYLTQEHEIFRQGFKKFLAKEAQPFIEKWEDEKMTPRSFWNKLGGNGYLCPQLDEKYGGFNADFGYSVVIAEELTKMAGGFGISLHSDIVMPYLESFANEEQKQRWYPGCLSGGQILAIAMTEPGAGSDLANIRTTAVRDGDYYIVNGEKTFITNGYSADLIILAVKTDPKATPAHKGISLIVVEADKTPGFTRGKKLKKLGQHVNDTSELIFADARVPVSNLLGEEGKGFYYLMQKLQQERLVVALEGIVTCEVMLDLTLEYVKQRKAFGKPISQFQNTQFKIADLATEITIGRTFIDTLIRKHMDRENIVTEVSMAKMWSTELAKKVAGECMQLHGGYGYMEEYEIARRYRDVPVSTIYAGTNEIMKTIIAKNLEL